MSPDTETLLDATSLELERTYHASAEEVFDAWTDPEVLRRWWAADPAWRTPAVEVDLRPGGRYRLSMEDPSRGAVHTVVGEYLDVERPARLRYTWQWEQGGETGPASTVEVRFLTDGARTTVVLRHTGLQSPESRERHRHGWEGCLESLRARVFPRA
jgi:uncharacterized protein YndB with AHSA1/START domain